jgi:hypothetical protein
LKGNFNTEISADPEQQGNHKVLLISILTLSSLFSILGITQKIEIPEPLILALFGIAIYSIAAFVKRRHSWE